MYPYHQQQIFYLRLLRKSSKDEQRRQWHSIENQRNEFDNYDRRTGAVCLGEYMITGSADKGKNFRDLQFKAMWRKARQNRHQLTHVLCTYVDRFGRAGGDYLKWFEAIMELDIEVNFIKEWFDFSIPEVYSQFYARIGNAQAEIKRLGMRTCDGKRGLRERGYYNDSLPPCWAYEPERRADGRKYAVKVEPAFEAYRIATTAFYKGASQAAAMRMARQATGHSISKSAFSRWLLMPLAYGYVPVWDNYRKPMHARKMIDLVPSQNIPAMFEDLNMFYEIRDRVKRIAPASAGKARPAFNPEFPLSYDCYKCGGPMRAYLANPKRKTPTPYYDCPSCGKDNRIHRKKANAMIAEVLAGIQIDPRYLKLAKEGAKRAMHQMGLNDSAKKGQLNKELTSIENRIKHLEQNMTSFSPEVYNKSYQNLIVDRTKVKASLDSLESERFAGLDIRSKLMGFLANIGEWYLNEANGYQQAQLLNTLFPEGYTLTQNGFRTIYVNAILASIATIPEVYVMKKGENSYILPFSPRSGRGRDEIRTIQADIIVLQDFFASLKAVA